MFNHSRAIGPGLNPMKEKILTRKIQIAVVDPDAHSRESVSRSLLIENEFEVNATCSGGKELMNYLYSNQSSESIILYDISMKNDAPYETSYLGYIHRFFPKSKIIVQSFQKVGYQIYQMYQRGIPGYLFKDCSHEELKTAIYSVASENTYYQPEVRHLMDDYVRYSTKKQDHRLFLTQFEKTFLSHLHKLQAQFSFKGDLKIDNLKDSLTWENICLKFGTRDLNDILHLSYTQKLLPLPG